MKYFKSDFQGLLPMFLDDLRFVNDAIQEQIEAIIKSFSEDAPSGAFILTGCEISGTVSSAQVSEGWVVLNNKLYRVPTASIPTNDPHLLYFYIQENILSGGTKQPKRTSSTVETYREKIGVLQTSINNPGIIKYSDIPRFIGGALDWPWKQITLETGFDHDSTNPLRYKRNGNTVEIRGIVYNNTTPFSGLIANLPNEIRPDITIIKEVMYENSSIVKISKITIDDAGQIIYAVEGNDKLHIQIIYNLT